MHVRLLCGGAITPDFSHYAKSVCELAARKITTGTSEDLVQTVVSVQKRCSTTAMILKDGLGGYPGGLFMPS